MFTSDATPNAFLALLYKDADGLGLMPILAAGLTPPLERRPLKWMPLGTRDRIGCSWPPRFRRRPRFFMPSAPGRDATCSPRPLPVRASATRT